LRHGFSQNGWGDAYLGYRADLGRGILLGLELLVAAASSGRLQVTPSFESLGVLAAIVLIRTFLSVSLEVEIEGRWPWRRRSDEQRRPARHPARRNKGRRCCRSSLFRRNPHGISRQA
jgi:hypothetical protein